MTENPGKLERINQILRSSPTTPANYAKFAESAPITSRLGVNPENSRMAQQMTQILHLSHNARANNAKFATFAHKYKISILSLTHCAHVLLHIFCIYAHILHHCRLVLSTSDFTVKTVSYNKCKCMLPTTCHFRTNCTLYTHNTTKKKKVHKAPTKILPNNHANI